MGWRIEESDLTGIIRVDPSVSLAPFIDMANVAVDRIASNKGGGSLTSAELAKLEALLACHFYALRDQPVSSKSTMGASGSFQGQWGMGLDATRCGQTAKTLLELAGVYPSGGLATAAWLGKPPSEQINYIDRN